MADFEAERKIMREAIDAWYARDGVKPLHIDITVEDGRVFGFDAFATSINVEDSLDCLLGFSLTLQSTGWMT